MSENGKEGANPAPNEAGKDVDIYENRKGLKKLIRIITVMAYLVSVSFVALVLSGYYIFLWQPPTPENLGLRAEPRVEYLMENPPTVARVSNRSISELTEKMNVFIKSGIYQRKMNKTKIGITRMQENITGNFLQAILKSKEHFETPTSAYKPDGKLDEMMDDVTTSTERYL
uniref:Uncharacterized protein n=1 Tax=Bracon brevicornis TaxID=1563983 RepID=A0A6V7L3Z9_9HYME